MSLQTCLAVPFLVLTITAFTLVTKSWGHSQCDKEGNLLGMLLAGILSLVTMSFLLVRSPGLPPFLEDLITILSALLFVALGGGMYILQHRWRQIIRPS